MTSSLHTNNRDPQNLFAARNGTQSFLGSPSTAHLCRQDTTQTLRFQAFRHTGRAAGGHSTVSPTCPMFTYLVHSIVLFCAAVQSHWPKVQVCQENVEKKPKSFSRRPMTAGGYFKIRSFESSISCTPREIQSHETRQSIDTRASSAANERLCTSTPQLKPGLSSQGSWHGSSAVPHLPPPLPPPSPSCLPRSPL